MHPLLLSLAFGLATGVTCTSTVAATSVDLFALSLDELTQLKVNVAGKTPQLQEDAPAIVSIITRNDLRRYGGRNLADVLMRSPGMLIFGSSLMDNTAVSMRGGKLTHTDDWVLLLINGRPLRESHNGGLTSDIYNLFPLDIIERIEIMRGPGSVLYGTNAFTGVINIVTREFTEENPSQFALTTGSFDTHGASLTAGTHGEDASMSMGFRVLDTDGWAFTGTDEAGVLGSRDREMSGGQWVLHARYQDFSINSIIGNLDQFTAGLFQWDLASGDTFQPAQVQRRFVDLGYHPQVNDDWRLEFNHSYGGHQFADRSARRMSAGSITELTSFYDATDKLQLTSGAVIDILDGDLNTRVDGGSYSIERYSAYLQADYQWQPELKSILGIQWNHSQGLSSDYSPRVGLVGQMSEQWGYKLLYGQAYRNAYAFQQFFNVPGFVGNPELKPELISTVDLQVNVSLSRTTFAVSYFNSSIDDSHLRVSNAGIATVENSDDKIHSEGVEFELKHQPSRTLNVESSLLYQKNHDREHDDVLFNPRLMAKLGVVYIVEPLDLSFGLFNSHFSAAGKLEDLQADIDVVNPAAKAYNLLTFNIVWKPPETDSLELSLYGDNLLDEDIYFPDLNRRAVNTLPQHSGRAFYLNIDYSLK